jgi:hypothetical protein
MPHDRRPGITLLEVLLALALTGVVMLVVSMAIDLNLWALDIRRSNVEQAQVARAVLRHIATDLRSAVRYVPIDLSGVSQVAGNAASSGAALPESVGGAAAAAVGSSSGTSNSTGSSGGTQAASGSSGRSTGGQSSGAAAGSNSAASGISLVTGSTQATSVTGLYGSQDQLQVDVSRLPRVDQYDPSLAGSAAQATVPCDVKTVAYYLRTGGETPTATAGTGSSAASNSPGLVRRELGRAVASYAALNGGGDSSDTGQVLAPEVNRLEFRYFDGTEWATEWDSSLRNGLPMAVEIIIGIDPNAGADPHTGDTPVAWNAAEPDPPETTYRLVVRLPMAEPTSTSTSTSTGDTGGQEALGL